MRRGCRWGVGVLLAGLVSQVVHADCKIALLADLTVTMRGSQPLIDVTINDVPTHLIVDSGAFMSLLSPGKAAEFKLPLRRVPIAFALGGVGGATTDVQLARIDRFGLGKVIVRDAEFMVAGNEYGYDAAGLLGQNLWANFDIEYDLANGHIRLMRPSGCGTQPLAYWAAQAGQTPSQLDILPAKETWHTVGEAEINGRKIQATFDTGASSSIVSLRAADRAGVHSTDPTSRPAGASVGITRGYVESWIAPFSSFKVGAEEVHNTHLRIGDLAGDLDMLLGADFFLSHRIYVSNQQHRLYFTYNGGRVFDLSTTPATNSTAGTAQPGAESSAPSSVPVAPVGDALEQANADSQRGAAFAARRQFAQALSELDRACQLAPTNPDYHVERAHVHLELAQRDEAMKDFDAALDLRSTDLDARLGRAGLKADLHDLPGARADLDAAVEASTPESDARFDIAMLYSQTDELERSAAEFDVWIAAHPRDIKLDAAHAHRCWLRALRGEDLSHVLAQCDDAVGMAKRSAMARDGRGLVRLRTGAYKQSMEDFDVSVSVKPKDAWGLYGRGLDHLYLGQTAQGKADIATAVTLQADIAALAAKYGITPPTQ